MLESLVNLIEQYGILIPFFILVIDSSTPIGVLMPGLWANVAVGVLVSTGYTDIYTGFFICLIGTIIGDYTGFALGYWFEFMLFQKKHLVHMQKINKYKKFWFIFIVFYRFIPTVRSVIPNMLGLLRVRKRIFLPANMIGAVVWVSFYMSLGYNFGEQAFKYQNITNVATFIIVIASLLVLYKYFKGHKEELESLSS